MPNAEPTPFPIKDRDDSPEEDLTVCAWNREVPPEEEVLTLKFAMEHREGWVRQMYAA